MELRHYWQMLVKRYRTLLWVVGVTVSVTLIFSLIATPVYEFTSKIWIRTSDPKSGILAVLPTDLASLGTISSDLVMQGQLRIIQSYPLLREVITNLRLEKKKGHPYAVQDILNPGSIGLILGKKGLTFRVPQSTQLIEVEAYSDLPGQAVEMANQVAEKFVDLYNDIIRDQAKKALEYLQAQIPQMEAELRDAERALYQYRIANQTSDISYYREKLISNLSTLEEGRDTAVRETLEAEKKIKEVLAKLKTLPEFRQASIGYEANPRIDYLRKKIVDLEAEVTANSQKLTPQHLTVKQGIATLGRYKDILRKEVKEILSSRTQSRNSFFDSLVESLGNAEINAAIYRARRQIYDQLIPAKTKQLGELTQKEMDQVPLERKVTAIKDNFTKLLSNRQTAKLALESSLSNAIIVERASLPELAEHIKRYRWFPQRGLLLILAMVLSLLTGLIIISFQEYLDNSVSDPQEAESAFKVPVLATLPELPQAEPFKVFKVTQSKPWQRSIWQIRALLRSQGISAGIIAITSAAPQEGKTILTASLGQVLALDKCRVLLVDLNFAHPGLGKLWQLPPGPGVCEVLQGTNLINKCLHATGPGELQILPNGRGDGLPLGYWDPGALATMLEPLKSDYDFILLDLPAVGEGEGALFTGLADHTILVIAARETPKNMVSRALEQINRCRGKVWGLVLNNVPQAPDQITALWAKVQPRIAQCTGWPGKFPQRGGN